MYQSNLTEARAARLCHSHHRRGKDYAPGSAGRRASKRDDRRVERRRLSEVVRRRALEEYEGA